MQMPFFWIRRFHEAACSPDRSRLGRVVGGNKALEREVRRLLAIWKVPSREPVVGESQRHRSLVFDRGCSTLGGPVDGGVDEGHVNRSCARG